MKALTLASLALAPSLVFAETRGPETVVVPPTRGISPSVDVPDELQPVTPLEIVAFDRASAILGPAEVHELDLLAGWMKRYPDQQLVLAGYADHLGTPADDLDLAVRRADIIRDHLRLHGVKPDRVVIASYSEPGPADRRVVVLASDRPVRELVTALARIEAPAVVWTEHGKQHETRGPRVSKR